MIAPRPGPTGENGRMSQASHRPRRRSELRRPIAGHHVAYDRNVDRKRSYFLLMGLCISLILLAWFVVRFYSTPAAIAMSVVAMVIPPLAAMIGNRS
jgi:hypothetical protein